MCLVERLLSKLQMACSLCVSAPGMLRSGSEARAASRRTTMWSSAAWSDWSIQSMLPDMWQALRVTSTRWLTESRRAVALRTRRRRHFWLISLFFQVASIYFFFYTRFGAPSVITWHPGGSDPVEGTWIWPRRPPCESREGREHVSIHPLSVCN